MKNEYLQPMPSCWFLHAVSSLAERIEKRFHIHFSIHQVTDQRGFRWLTPRDRQVVIQPISLP